MWNLKNQSIGVLVKKVTCGMLVHMIACEVKWCEIGEYLDIKNGASNEHVIKN